MHRLRRREEHEQGAVVVARALIIVVSSGGTFAWLFLIAKKSCKTQGDIIG
jgi:hypothetical protein